MKQIFTRPGFALVALALATGCGSEAPEQGAAQNVTRGLLSAAAEGGAGGSGDRRPGPLRQVPVTELGFDRGTAGAPIRLMELSDYGCGYCRRFHVETFPALEEEFIETGIVEWKFVPYVTGMFENSRTALRGAECTLEQSDEAFERLDRRLWEDQEDWKSSDDAAGLIRGWALQTGIDADAYDTCQAQGRRLHRIAAAEEIAREMGVRGTPTFFVVGYGPLQGALPLDTFRQVLRSVHEDVRSRQDGSGG